MKIIIYLKYIFTNITKKIEIFKIKLDLLIKKMTTYQLSNENEITFDIPFLESDISKVISYVMENSKLDLKSDPSCEGGFYLKLDSDWIRSINEQNQDYSWNLVYHGTRSFRFVKNGNYINGIRCKDNLRYWTNEEMNEIKNKVNDFISNISSSSSSSQIP